MAEKIKWERNSETGDYTAEIDGHEYWIEKRTRMWALYWGTKWLTTRRLLSDCQEVAVRDAVKRNGVITTPAESSDSEARRQAAILSLTSAVDKYSFVAIASVKSFYCDVAKCRREATYYTVARESPYRYLCAVCYTAGLRDCEQEEIEAQAVSDTEQIPFTYPPDDEGVLQSEAEYLGVSEEVYHAVFTGDIQEVQRMVDDRDADIARAGDTVSTLAESIEGLQATVAKLKSELAEAEMKIDGLENDESNARARYYHGIATGSIR